MLVCNVSLRPLGRTIAAGIAEAGAAVDDLGIGNIVFATLVDDPASVGELVDAYLGEIMLEAASASDTIDAGFTYAATIAETVTSADTQDGSVTAAPVSTTFNPADLVNVTLSGGNLIATGSGQGGVRSVASHSSGKYYFEYTLGTFTNGNTGVGIGNASAVLGTVGPSPLNAAIIYNSGNVYIHNVSQSIFLGSISSGTVIGIAVDRSANLIWFRVAPSGNWNGSGTANPATGTGGVSLSTLTGALFGLFAPGASGQAVTANFGASAFTGSVPSGFTAGF